VAGLSDAEKDQFRKLGYVIRPGMIDPARAAAVAAEIDRWVEAEPRFDGRNIARYDRLCDLIVDPETLAITDDVMGGDEFTFHHCHAARHDPGLPGIAWHHDYEQIPQTNRSHVQLHVLHYLDGLNGTVGDLLLLPKSHRAVMRRDALAFLGDQEIPGTVVLNDIPPGTVVFAHSALVHARRAQPGGGDRKRYFIDIAFMQAGVQWPSYGREGWRDTIRAMDARLHDPARPRLFDETAFFDIADAVARVKGATGSLAMRLPEPVGVERPVSGAIPIVQ
jgi:ectoine hydroxylase-related dioxygenase (phytanoyl-CoA dioxygenase family)